MLTTKFTQFKFRGKLHPSAAELAAKIPQLTLESGLFPGMTLDVDVKYDNTVEIDCRVPKENEEKFDFDEVIQITNEVVRSAFDFAAFSSGIALTFVMDEFEDEVGLHGLVIQIPQLKAAINNVDKVDFFSELLRMYDDINLRLAVTDLNFALNSPNVRPINCARAIESLRHAISPDAGNRSEAWAKMRQVLNVSEQCLREISDASVAARHGDWMKSFEKYTLELMEKTWAVVWRYLEFKRRGAVDALPYDEFPTL